MSQDNLTAQEIRDLVDKHVGRAGAFEEWLKTTLDDFAQSEILEHYSGELHKSIDYAALQGFDPADTLIAGTLLRVSGASPVMMTQLALILAAGKLTPRHLQLLEGLGLELDFFWAWSDPELASKERDQFLLHQGWAEGFSTGSPRVWESEPENPYPDSATC